MCAATALACATSLLAFRERIPAFFTADDAIKGLTSDLLCVVAVFQLPDAVNGAVQGVFRGSGRQNLGARLNFVAYYLLGIPDDLFISIFALGRIPGWTLQCVEQYSDNILLRPIQMSETDNQHTTIKPNDCKFSVKTWEICR